MVKMERKANGHFFNEITHRTQQFAEAWQASAVAAATVSQYETLVFVVATF